jgi:tetratricopeptide (TPR) repeat protein
MRDVEALLRAQHFVGALTLLDDALRAARAARKASKLWELKSLALAGLGRNEEALEAAQRAVQLDPRSVDAVAARAATLGDLNRLNEALREADEVVRRRPAEARAWLLKGQVLTRLGRHDDALAAYERALELSPDNPLILRGKGDALRALERHAEALGVYRTAFSMFGEDATPVGHIDVARAARAIAEHASTTAVVGDPTHEVMLLLRGMMLCHQQLQHFSEAYDLSQLMRRVDSADGTAWYVAAAVLVDLHRYQEALDASTRVVELEPDFANGWYSHARALGYLDRPQEALAADDRALQLAPGDATFRSHRAGILVRLQLYHALPADLDLSHEPELALSEVWGNEAQMQRWFKHYPEALTACDEAIERAPRDFRWPAVQASIYLRQRRYLAWIRTVWRSLAMGFRAMPSSTT